MEDFEKQFKKDFEDASPKDLSFDINQLEPNTRKIRHKWQPWKKIVVITSSALAACLVALIAIPISVFYYSSLRTTESVKTYKKNYSINEVKIAESNTFKKLNSVIYPEYEQPVKGSITQEEETAYADFSDLTYHALVNTSKEDNMSYSIVGLYSLLNEMTNAASRDELKTRFNTLLGLNEESRAHFYEKVIQANSFAKDESTTQIKNAVFFNNRFAYSQEFVNSLAKLYCEAYQLDFVNEANRIVDWVNQAVNTKGFIDKNFLEMNQETQLYLFSTLYFKNAWATKYLSQDNVKDDFHLADGSTIKTTFMKHSYHSDIYYDYGSYIAVKDYYKNSYASVTYLVPKKVEDNIFNLTKNVNIFENNAENAVEANETRSFIINLTTPKFSSKSSLNFKSCLTNLGFGDIFEREIDSFKNAFSGDDIEDINFYLQKIKQKNDVEFNEDGSIIKSVTMGTIGGAESMPMQYETLDVNLNQPFIYIVRDINNTPIFVGHVDNPKK